VGVSGTDGIRQDTLPYVHRRFWTEWMAAIKREYPDLKVVGELFDGDPVLVSFYQGGKRRWDGIDSGIDTLFDFPLFFKIREAFARGGSLREVAMTLARDHLYEDASTLVTFLGLHDVPRFMNEPRASVASLKSAFTLLCTARGVPLVYYGDEIAMPGGGDPDNRRDFPGGFPGDIRSAFEAAGRTESEESVHRHLSALLRLRSEEAALRRGRTVNLHVGDHAWAYARVLDGRSLVVAISTDDAPSTLDLPAGPAGLAEGTRIRERLGSALEATVERGRLKITLPPASSVVFAP
jgi:glycosidase